MGKRIFGYVLSFFAGGAVSIAMLMLTSRFSIDITHHFFVFAAIIVIGIILLFTRTSELAKRSRVATALSVFGHVVAFLFGAIAGFYSLMALDPPVIK
jgi:hypothetical protein